MRTRLLFVVAALLFVSVASSPATAQTVTGSLQGTVTDATGAVLPGVTITIRNLETGAVREGITNDRGFYAAPFLPIGRYSVTARLAGFASYVRDNVAVDLNETRVADFQLKPASVEETVTVVGAAPPINSVNAEVKDRLSAEQIMDKPTISPGSFLSLAEVFPGFQDNPTSGQNNPTASSGSSINFNGTGTRGATFQINGVNNDDSSENQNRQGAALSTIKEFQVITNTYSAEFGRGYGAVVLVQTKSGTNQIRGDAYEYFQDGDDLTGLRKFATVKPNNQRHQFGGTIGFPILKNRIFGFVSADRTKLDGKLNYARDLLLPNERTPRLTRGNDTPANRAWINGIISRYPTGVTPNDPRSNRTYATVIGFNWPDEDYSGRFDWQLGQDSVTGRYQYTHQIRETDDVILGEQARQDNAQQNFGLTWTKIFRNTIVGEFRYGLGLRDTNVNIAAGNTTPIVRFTGSPVSGTIIGNAGAFPILRDQRDNQFVYNLTWLAANNHNVKLGTDVRRQQLDDFADNNSRGFWNFNRVCAGTTYPTAYDAFLDGCIASHTMAYGPFFLENRINEANFYLEDNWRVTPTLTLNLGFRYEYVSAPSEKEGRLDYGISADDDNYEPRFGLAWTPRPSEGWLQLLTGREVGDSSLRGGYGITHGRIFQSVFSQSGASLRGNPPLALTRVVTNSLNVSDPTGGFVFVPGVQTTRHTITTAASNLEMPYTHQWSMTYERKLPFESSLRVSYNGNHVIGTLKYALDNLPVSPLAGGIRVVDHPNNAPATGFPDLRNTVIDRIAANVQCAGTGLPGLPVNATCPVVVPIANNEISLRVPRTNERRPNPPYGTNLKVSNDAESWYQGVQIEWVKRVSKGLQFLASYTRSRSLDTTSEATFVGAGDSNQLGPKAKFAKGYSRFHTPHRFTLNGSYVLPFWADRRDLVGQVLGGWQVSGTLRLASGTPFTVTQTGLDLDFDGFSEGRPVLLDPSLVGRSIDNPATSTILLPRSGFRAYTVGDSIDQVVPRNAFTGDGLNTVDLGLYKSFRLGNHQALALRLQAFNGFDVVQYGFPDVNFSNSTFGQLTALHGNYIPRTLQLTARFTY